MNRFERILLVLCVWALIIAGGVLIAQEGRIKKLELDCRAQCTYGDSACAKRCDKLGHCPFQQQ